MSRRRCPATRPVPVYDVRRRRRRRDGRRSREPTRSSSLRIADLHAKVAGHEILRGVDLEVRSGEVHALMGPNGSGKSTLSHTLMGRGDYEVTGGFGHDRRRGAARPADVAARAEGLFLAMQYPVEVPGVRLEDMVDASLGAAARSLDGLDGRASRRRRRRSVSATSSSHAA